MILKLAALILLQVSVCILSAHHGKGGESGPYSHIIPSCHFSFANNTEIFVTLPVLQKTVCVHLCVSACVYNTERQRLIFQF